MKKLFKQTLLPHRAKPILPLLFLCCILGLISGWLASRTITTAESESLRSYLEQYALLTAQGSTGNATLPVVIITYFRYPLILFLLGFTGWGAFLIPLVCLGQGFFLSYAVFGFVASLGGRGVALAISTFGFRCLLTLPCILLIATRSMESAMILHHESGRTKYQHILPSAYGAALGICLLLLTLGIIAELKIVPCIFRIVIQKIGLY